MKKAVILHGTDGNPEANWFPWLKQQLEEQGYEVWVPLLPENHTPNREVYNNFLFNSGWDFTNNIIIGHSAGAVSILNMLMDDRCPHIKLGAMVGAWSHMQDTDLDIDQFKHLFPPEGFDFPLIKSKADKLVFLHGDNDPLCPLAQARWLAEQLDSEITIVPYAGHFYGKDWHEIPQLMHLLEPSL